MDLLTGGIIKRIFACQDKDNLPSNPVLQVMGIKKLSANQGLDRFRIVVSDGVHYYTSAMLGTQLNHLVNNDLIEPKAIVRLDQYTSNIIQGVRKVIIILGLTVLKTASEVQVKLGNPQQFSDNIEGDSQAQKQEAARPSSTSANLSSASNRNGNPQASNLSSSNQMGKNPAANNANSAYGSRVQQSKPSTGASNVNVHPISSLTPYQNRWTICARITNKAPIRHWSNSKGEGKLFSIDLLDETGEIRATAFNNMVDKYYDMIEKDKVYYISKCTLKTANKQYSTLKNDYEMQFTNETIMEECTDDVDLPKIQFDFVPISDLENKNKDALVDIIGIVKSAAETTQITTRATNKQVSKRDLTLVDRSEKCVNATIWGSEAESFEQYATSNPVVAIKGAKVSDFGGRSLSVLGSSVFHINPDIDDAHGLRGWYDKIGKDKTMESLSGQRNEGGGSSKFKTISQIKAEGLGMGDKADYFQLRPVILSLKKDNCLYNACPTKDCNKKVIEQSGNWRCEKCDKTFPDFKYRIVLQANTGDFTGNQWITCFQDSAEKILRISANELGNLRDSDMDAFEQVFSTATFEPFNLTIRAKMETYNDEARLKCSAVSAENVDFKEGARVLLKEINKLRSM